jgi:carbamate kinase
MDTREPTKTPDRLLVALGGNAIHPEGIRGTGKEQFDIAYSAAQALLPVLTQTPQLVVTHGNGPGVGKVLLRQAIARKRVASMPLDICVANSQGGISYVIMQAMQNAMRSVDFERHLASVVCEVEVNLEDSAFQNPDKPLGYFFSEEEAQNLVEEFGWTMKEDAGRGWRMVVPSPQPQKIIGREVVSHLLERNIIVITAGGGGIPVSRNADGRLRGVEAVIDKDLTSSLLARELGFDDLLIVTSIEHVKLHFGTDKEQNIHEISLKELKRHHQHGHFSAGSMEPKIHAVIQFLENGGKRAVIAHLEQAHEALLGRAGTRVSI